MIGLTFCLINNNGQAYKMKENITYYENKKAMPSANPQITQMLE
jgi:hypothetical protein